jgi:hypothetical protein
MRDAEVARASRIQTVRDIHHGYVEPLLGKAARWIAASGVDDDDLDRCRLGE